MGARHVVLKDVVGVERTVVTWAPFFLKVRVIPQVETGHRQLRPVAGLASRMARVPQLRPVPFD
jgi:hypothetical protein